ncbi:MAG: invasion associated locus B family protein, partial [Rhodovibrionaceae bacterium]
AAVVAVATPERASAQALERLGDFKDWSAFSTSEGGGKVCFMSSQPLRDEGNYTNRGSIYTFITHRPSDGRVGEVNIKPGYTYQADSRVKVTIDGRDFDLVTKDSNAWPYDPQTDKQMIEAMIRGSSMIVRGTSSRGTLTTDTYSLLGFTNAYQAITEACGV